MLNIIECLVKTFNSLKFFYSLFQKFPDDGIVGALRNVFDFDAYSPEVMEILRKTFHKHGIPYGTSPYNVKLAKR